MSSTFGRPLRALVSSSTLVPRPSLRHSFRRAPSQAPPASIGSLARRAYAALPPSTPAPPIALPPPPSAANRSPQERDDVLSPTSPASAPESTASAPASRIEPIESRPDSSSHHSTPSPSIPPSSEPSRSPLLSSDPTAPPTPSPSMPKSSSPTSPQEKPSPSPDSEGASFEKRFNDFSSQAQTTIRQAANQTSVRFWKEADHLATQAVSRFSMMGAKLNEITGYDRIEGLKKVVSERETDIANLRSSLLKAKQTYLSSVSARSTSQREVNDLLQRKPTWRSYDVDRFTVLVREDHDNSRLEEESKAEMEGAEGRVESAFTELMNAILNRYHEEQLWSDKLRSFSTYVSLAVMLANLLVFITAIVFVEPYKRKRLAQTFEVRVGEMTDRVEAGVEAGVERVLRALEARGVEGAGAALQGAAAMGGEEKVAVAAAALDEPKAAVVEPVAAAAATAAEEKIILPADTPPPSPPAAPKRYIPFLPSFTIPTSFSLPSISLPTSLPTPSTLSSHLPSLSSSTPQDLLDTSKDALDASREFVARGIAEEGRERDLLVVGAGGAVAGAGLAGIVWGLFR